MSSAEERIAYKQSMPKRGLLEKHVEHCKILPNRTQLLHRLKRNAVVAEIGVAFGDFSDEIWQIAAPRKFHLIDAWDSYRYKEGLNLIRQKYHEEIDKNIIEVNIGYSIEVLYAISDYYFDWIYIDTNHSYETTKQELGLASRKCKAGGRICGHDFTCGNVITPVPYGVIEACHEFCIDNGWEYEYLTLEHHGHFSFCLKEIA